MPYAGAAPGKGCNVWQLLTCFRTKEFARGWVGELSDRGDCGFWGDSGGCKDKAGIAMPSFLDDNAVITAQTNLVTAEMTCHGSWHLQSLVLSFSQWQVVNGGLRGLTIEIANKAVADCGDSGELGTGIEGGLQTPTLPFLASSNNVRTWRNEHSGKRLLQCPLAYNESKSPSAYADDEQQWTQPPPADLTYGLQSQQGTAPVLSECRMLLRHLPASESLGETTNAGIDCPASA